MTRRAGDASLLSDNASRAILQSSAGGEELDAVNRAVELTPLDPEAHLARAEVLRYLGRDNEEISEFSLAAALRPRDYYLWLRLGFEQYHVQDMEGARISLMEAVRLAPHYAQPRFWLGNSLLKLDRRGEAFEQLHRAATSDPSLLPSFISLAWQEYDGDTIAVEQIVQPQTDSWRLALAQFFANNGKPTEAITLFRAINEITEQNWRAFLNELLAAKRFAEAYEVWAAKRNISSESHNGIAAMTDGSFENEIHLDYTGFEWQVARDLDALNVNQDSNEPRAGEYSLRLDWSGNSDPSTPVVSQLVRVEAKTIYRLGFAARTQEMVTGGLPLVVLTDAGDGAAVGQSTSLPRGTSGWNDYTVEFTTGGTTNAVLIAIRRQNCTSAPCPIFGSAWFDEFTLRKLGKATTSQSAIVPISHDAASTGGHNRRVVRN